ncbi:hypothetical protein BGZ96_004013 [Linnemannia gamsii]|uniref:WD40 repeat-like protein n=1 Tax=Linnemannia gamsii TaxID=64522 RepID=A0ABQ7JIP0_9FUNG|nr:hypothetical protein BGZ96_004013 [Linnemannia gamsii]
MSGHTGNVKSVVFSPCGKQIASAGDDGTVRLWDSETRESLFVLKGHTKPILSVKYSPDGRQLISGSEDQTVRVWNTQSGELDHVLRPSLGYVLCLAYSPDGRWVASGHKKGVLQLWNAATGELGPVLRGHFESVTGIEFSPCSQWLASSSHDRTVRLWDMYSSTLLSVSSGLSTCECVAFSPDSLQIASGSNRRVRLQEVGGNDWKVRLREVGGCGWKVRLRDIATRPSSRFRREDVPMDQIAYTPDGRNIFAQDSNRVLRKWDAGTGESSEFLPPEFAEPERTSCMAFTPDGSQIAVSYPSGSIHLWNSQTSTPGPVLEGHSSRISTLVYSPCSRWIASVDWENTVRLWDLHNTEQLHVVVEIEQGDIVVVVFSPNSDQLAIGNRGTIRLFDLLSTEHLTFNELTDDLIQSMVYSLNGRQIAIGDTDGCIQLWDVKSTKFGDKLIGHHSNQNSVRCIAYSPCGQWIASGGQDTTVVIWRRQVMGGAESWSRCHSIGSFFRLVCNVAWNPVGPMELVTGCWDGSIRVWRLSSDKDGNVAAKMLWGSNLGILHTAGLVFENATGLSPVNQKLLDQHNVIAPINDQSDSQLVKGRKN